MTHLYSCKSDINQHGVTIYRITKFDADLNVESSYLCDEGSCGCPAGERPSCRHRQMLPRFLARGAVNTMWMHDFDRNGWVSQELEISYHKTLPDDATPEQVAEAFAGLSEAEAEHRQEQNTVPHSVEADVLGTLPDGIQMFDLSKTSPVDLFNAIADAVGEPRHQPRPTRITLNRRGF